MYKFFIFIPLLLMAAFSDAHSQASAKASETGGSVKASLFKDGIPKQLTITAPKPKEAFITSKDALRQHIFPGGNGTGGGVPRSFNSGARKAKAQAPAAAGQLPSTQSAAESAQKAKAGESAKAAPAIIDPAAQGKEPSLHYDKPKEKTLKN